MVVVVQNRTSIHDAVGSVAARFAAPCPATEEARDAPQPYRTTAAHELHLVTRLGRIDPVTVAPGLFRFQLAVPAGPVRLVSRSGRPSQLGIGEDHRQLGFCVRSLAATDGCHANQLQAASDICSPDFYDEPTPWRWTNGNALLPRRLFTGLSGAVELLVEGNGLPRYTIGDLEHQANAALFLQFISVGDNCEFGFAQRHYGAEPLDLLRWATGSLQQLHNGLALGFAGLGDVEKLVPVWSEAGEYRLEDGRYLTAHTGAHQRRDHVGETELVVEGAARLRLLRRKLLHELQTGQRICVFKTDAPDFDLSAMRQLHAALRRRGPAELLCVVPAGQPDQAGTVQDHGGGLMLGQIERFVMETGPYDQWRELCRKALALRTARLFQRSGTAS